MSSVWTPKYLTERIFVPIVSLRECLVDDDRTRSAGGIFIPEIFLRRCVVYHLCGRAVVLVIAVALLKLAAGQKWKLHRCEVARRRRHCIFLTIRLIMTWRNHLYVRVASFKKTPSIPYCGALNTGKSFDAPLKLVQEDVEIGFLRDIAEPGAYVDHRDVVRVESGIDGEQISQAEQEARAGDDEHEREGDLDADEGPPQTKSACFRTHAAKLSHRFRAGCLPCRKQSEENRGARPDRGAENEYA